MLSNLLLGAISYKIKDNKESLVSLVKDFPYTNIQIRIFLPIQSLEFNEETMGGATLLFINIRAAATLHEKVHRKGMGKPCIRFITAVRVQSNTKQHTSSDTML